MAAALAAVLAGCNPTPPGPRAALQPGAPPAPTAPAPTAVKPEPPRTSPVVAAPADEAPKEPGPKMADVKLIVSIVGDNYHSPVGAVPPGPWLYVDDRLVRSFTGDLALGGPWTYTEALSLPPGKHEFSVGYTTYGDSFPLGFYRQVGRIEPGREQTLPFTLPAPSEITYSDASIHPFVSLTPEGRQLVQHMLDVGDERQALYTSDKVVTALSDLKKSFKTKRPNRGAVLVDLPETVGGPHELDVRQVGLVIDWLRYFYCDSFLCDGADGPYFQDLSPKVRRLMTAVKLRRDAIEEFRSIVRDLENAPD